MDEGPDEYGPSPLTLQAELQSGPPPRSADTCALWQGLDRLRRVMSGGGTRTALGILEALIPGRMQSHASTAEVPR